MTTSIPSLTDQLIIWARQHTDAVSTELRRDRLVATEDALLVWHDNGDVTHYQTLDEALAEMTDDDALVVCMQGLVPYVMVRQRGRFTTDACCVDVLDRLDADQLLRYPNR